MKNQVNFNPTILIIGGDGEIGKTFFRAFKKKRKLVYSIDKKNQKKLKTYLNKSNIIIISVPISETVSVLKKVAPLLRRDQLLMDFTSIKKDFIPLMKKLSNSEIISLHPLFGPLKNINKQNIILMKVRSKNYYPQVKKLFMSLGLKVVEIKISEHDQFMTVIQSLVHLMAFSLVATIKEVQFSFFKLEKASTPLYQLQIDLASRLLYQSAELYTDISILNPFLKKTGSIFQKNFKHLLDMLNQKKRKEFISFLRKHASFLKKKKTAFHRSEKIMEYLAQIK